MWAVQREILNLVATIVLFGPIGYFLFRWEKEAQWAQLDRRSDRQQRISLDQTLLDRQGRVISIHAPKRRNALIGHDILMILSALPCTRETLRS